MPECLPPRIALSIAGSDNSAGAGIQTDLKTFSIYGTYGLTAVTCVVAEVPGKVTSIQAIDPEVVAAQIRISFEVFPVAAAKTGMLFSSAIISAVAQELRKHPDVFLTVDPVMVATSGDLLIEKDAVELYRKLLFPIAGLVTPNLDEAATLIGRPIQDLDAMIDAGRELTATFNTSFLLKGGHLRQAVATDLLFMNGELYKFEAPYYGGISTHGTGCTYSAAITAGLACGLLLPEAVARAKRFVTRAISSHHRWRMGHATTDALNTFIPPE
jgi:hydroxymethylpyrimidine/phosphomethylpyrimidine kinase